MVWVYVRDTWITFHEERSSDHHGERVTNPNSSFFLSGKYSQFIIVMVFFESILYVVCSDNEELVH